MMSSNDGIRSRVAVAHWRGQKATAGLRIAAAFAAVTALAGCGILSDEPAPMPTVPEVRAFYEEHPGMADVRLSGNVVVVSITQELSQLRRGGSLWARVGPYIHLFSPSTRKLLDRYPGVAAVRVITQGPDANEIARAMLVRDTMSELRWRRSLNLLGHALQDGTSHPGRLTELAEWGESYTEYQYNPAYVPVAQ